MFQPPSCFQNIHGAVSFFGYPFSALSFFCGKSQKCVLLFREIPKGTHHPRAFWRRRPRRAIGADPVPSWGAVRWQGSFSTVPSRSKPLPPGNKKPAERCGSWLEVGAPAKKRDILFFLGLARGKQQGGHPQKKDDDFWGNKEGTPKRQKDPKKGRPQNYMIVWLFLVRGKQEGDPTNGQTSRNGELLPGKHPGVSLSNREPRVLVLGACPCLPKTKPR